jgi:hypothetical protein
MSSGKNSLNIKTSRNLPGQMDGSTDSNDVTILKNISTMAKLALLKSIDLIESKR